MDQEQTPSPTPNPRSPEESGAQQVVEKLSARKPDLVNQFLAMGMGPVGNPLHQKMNAEHISTVLDLAVKHDEREFQLAQGQQKIESSNRWFHLAVFVLVLAVIVTIIFMFQSDQDVLLKLITIIVAFAGGFGSGWGLAKRSS